MKIFAIISILVLSISSSNSIAGIDDLENIGPDSTLVTTRVIDGVTIAISTQSGFNLRSCTYYDSSPYAFNGAGGADNTPLYPENVSGSRFISTVGPNSRFQQVQPIIFDFDTEISSFGLTTLDLLENAESDTTWLQITAFNSFGTPVDSFLRVGRKGESGLDLDWVVSGPGITKVVLSGGISGADVGGFGIDDLVLIKAIPTINFFGFLLLVGALVILGIFTMLIKDKRLIKVYNRPTRHSS